ncbi:MAG: SulP family inorganic anion transporter [Thermodesulfobacteriota bacterium]
MIKKIFPFMEWFKNYNSMTLRADAIAGLTVALVLIPQSMAYAQLAGLPTYYGLYAAFLPPMVAALFGSSRQLATGPVAIVSMMTAASLAPLATVGSGGYIAYAILLSLMVGIFQLLLGVLRLGLVVNFLSHPVVNGFTNAGALLIATSQLDKIFGASVDTAEHNYETVIRVIQAAWNYTHWPTLIMGAGAFAIMYFFKKISPKIPNVLVAVALTTLLSWALGFHHDEQVPIDRIESERARTLIAEFNEQVRQMPELARQRTEINQALDKAKGSHDLRAVLDIEHSVSVMTFTIEKLKHDSAEIRTRIREMLFAGVKQPDGSLKFYLRNEVPPGAETDGRTWRIHIGNNPLKVDKLRIKGGGAVVGEVPSGLPAFSVPKIDFKVMGTLFSYAAIISLLGFMEAISIAKSMAGKTGQRLDPNQELIGQGLANILGSIGQSYPASGSFSRSAVNLQAGAVTGMSSVFTSLTVVITLFFFTPLLYYLPQSVLAAVIMMAVIGLLNVSGFVHAYRAQRYDGVISLISFIATMVFAPHLDKGIMIGVVLSLMVFIYKSMRPKLASLSRHVDEALRDASTHGLRECKFVSLVRFEGPLFFANASYLEDKIMELMRTRPKLKHIVIVSNGINDIDATGEEALSLLVDRVRSAGIDISMSGINEAVMQVLKRTHFPEKIGEDHIFPTMERAIAAIHYSTHKDGLEQDCPLLTACYLTT